MKRTILAVALALCALAAHSQEFVVGSGGDPQSLDPARSQGAVEGRIYAALFEGLTLYDPVTGRARPGLAEGWAIAPDSLDIVFTLRDAAWSDGTAITAQQVVDSWLRTLDPATASPCAHLVGQLVKGAAAYNRGAGRREDVAISAPDSRTFRMTLAGPRPQALDLLAHPAFAVLPVHAIRRWGDDWVKPRNWVSNGPFVLKEWIPLDHITVVKNEGYWDARNVKLASVRFLSIEDRDTLYRLYRGGEVDWDCSPPPGLVDQLRLRGDFQVSPRAAAAGYCINVTEPPFNDVRVRKALSMAIDRRELVGAVTRSGELEAESIVPAMPGYQPARGNGFDLQTARTLLADAGYPDGRGFPGVTAIYAFPDRQRLAGEWLQRQWKEHLGIEVGLREMEWKTFLEQRGRQDFQLAMADWAGDCLDPAAFLDRFASQAGNNAGGYANPGYDAMIERAAAQSGAPRMKTLHDAEEQLITRDQVVIPLYFPVNQDLIDLGKWAGWHPNPLGNHQFKFISQR
jgi:oligopeptide transport system substrate-binding protein